MGTYQAMQEIWKDKDTLVELWRQRLIEWRTEDVITSIERPTRLNRARSLGYRAKKGITIVRVRVARGGRKRLARKHGRRSRTMRRKKIVGMSYQWIAEQKAQRKYTNLEMLNSYYVGQDGLHYWYEVIMVDPYAPEIKSDKKLNWICYRKHTNRVLRGRTSAGQKSRGLSRKGKGAEKIRPSRRANDRLSK